MESVFGITRVDGAGEHLAIILTLSKVSLSNLGTDFFCRLFHILRIFIWQTILGEDGMHLSIVVAHLA